jgi:hypothetical protein
MTLKKVVTVLALAGVVFALLAFVPSNIVRPVPVAIAQNQNERSACVPVGGALMIDIDAITGKPTWARYLVICRDQWRPPSSDKTATDPTTSNIIGSLRGATRSRWRRQCCPRLIQQVIRTSGQLQILHQWRHRQVQQCHGLPGLLRDRGFPAEHVGAALSRRGLLRALRARTAQGTS